MTFRAFGDSATRTGSAARGVTWAGHLCNSLHRGWVCGRVAAMALEHAILVSLSERPASGLDLTRRFDRSIGFFWSATHQQIYRVLAPDGGRRLGPLDAGRAARAGPPRRCTTSPRPAAASWPGGSPQPPRWSSSAARWRSSCAAASYGDRAAVLAQVEEHRAEHATRLAHYEQLAARLPRPRRLEGHDLDVYLVLRGGIRLEQFWVDWLTEYLTAHSRRHSHERLPPPARPVDDRRTSRCATGW